MSRTYQEQVDECVRFIGSRLTAGPAWGIILGTGQGLWAGRLEGGGSLPYGELPHFPPATSPSHQGRLGWGRVAGKEVMVCQGRFHAYEGYSLRQVTFPVRVMASLGVKTLVVTNAAGGLNPFFKAGDLMLICDHINLMGDNLLAGENIDAWGPRFPDLSQVYDRGLREQTEAVARRLGIGLRQGVYVAVKGPSPRDPGGNPVSAPDRRRRSGHVHGARSHHRGACRAPGPGDLGAQQSQSAGCHGPHRH